MARTKQTARKTSGGRAPRSRDSSCSVKSEILGLVRGGAVTVTPVPDMPEIAKPTRRTKQTARKSTGGHAPRRALASLSRDISEVERPAVQINSPTMMTVHSETAPTAHKTSARALQQPTHLEGSSTIHPRQTARKSTGGGAPQGRQGPYVNPFLLVTELTDGRSTEVIPHSNASEASDFPIGQRIRVKLTAPTSTGLPRDSGYDFLGADFSFLTSSTSSRPRTKQTARKSTGGHAPRLKLPLHPM